MNQKWNGLFLLKICCIFWSVEFARRNNNCEWEIPRNLCENE